MGLADQHLGARLQFSHAVVPLSRTGNKESKEKERTKEECQLKIISCSVVQPLSSHMTWQFQLRPIMDLFFFSSMFYTLSPRNPSNFVVGLGKAM